MEQELSTLFIAPDGVLNRLTVFERLSPIYGMGSIHTLIGEVVYFVRTDF